MSELRRKSEPSFAVYSRRRKLNKRGQHHFPRPRNSFIMFRQYYHKSVQGEGPRQKTNSEVSKELGSRWKSLPADEKIYWENLAREEKELFAKRQEEYQFVNEQFHANADKIHLPVVNGYMPATSDNMQVPPLTNMMPSRVWLMPPNYATPMATPIPSPLGSHFDPVHPRTFQLPNPAPQVSSQMPAYSGQHQMFPTPMVTPQRYPMLSNYAFGQLQPGFSGNVNVNVPLLSAPVKPLPKPEFRQVSGIQSVLNA